MKIKNFLFGQMDYRVSFLVIDCCFLLWYVYVEQVSCLVLSLPNAWVVFIMYRSLNIDRQAGLLLKNFVCLTVSFLIPLIIEKFHVK